VQLTSRRSHDWTAKFPGITAAVAKLPARTAILDGEVAVQQADGRTSFGALQEALSAGAARGVTYFVFDLLYLDGRELFRVPLEARKLTLRAFLTGAPPNLPIRFSDHVVGAGPAFFAAVRARGLEGIISKRRLEPHRAGRSPGWLKIKATQRQEVVVGGFTAPEGSRAGLGSLLVGTYDGDRLVFGGGVGTGFDDATLVALSDRLRPMVQKDCPFDPPPPKELLRRPAHWVRPELVIEAEFLEWTGDGHLRHPSFRGLREDRDPREVRREVAQPLPGAASEAQPAVDEVAGPEPAEAPAEPTPEPAADTGGRTPVILGQRLSNPERVFYPALGFTKMQLARYYEAVGTTMLAHVKARPLTLVRCPEGVDHECFYAKHVATGARSPLVKIMIREKDGEDVKPEPYLILRDPSGLVALAQLGVLEIHTWNCVDSEMDRPDRFVLDLDPGPAVPFAETIAAARLIREVLRAVGFESWVKTTGGKGLHVVVPVQPVLDWEGCLQLSRAIAGLVVRQQPRKYTIALPKAGREDKILIDYLRNHRGSTSVAAFSTRVRPEATVSVPIAWDELGPDLRPDQFTVTNVPARLASLRVDPWADYWINRQSVREDVVRLLLPAQASQ
jgi:bifunctional non-homologous end joining protein LigD